MAESVWAPCALHLVDSWWGLRRVYVRTLPQGFTWRRVKAKHAGDGVPAPRAHHAAAQFREMMFVFGGSTAQVVPTLNSEVMVFTDHSALNDTKLGDLWAFNTTSETWHALEPSIDEQARDRYHPPPFPASLTFHTFGRSTQAQTRRADTLTLLRRNGHNATAPIARSHHTLVMGRGDAVFLYGGQAQSGLFISDVHVLQARELK